MSISTNKRGNGVIYAESPHMINLTCVPQRLLIEKSSISIGPNENYIADNITVGDPPIFQKTSKEFILESD